MALIFRDSFDFYNAASDAAFGFWDTQSACVMLPASLTRFGVGQGMNITPQSNSVELYKSWSTNPTTVFFALPMKYAGTFSRNNAVYAFRIYSGVGNIQLSVVIYGTGVVQFYRGNFATLLGTWSPGMVGNSWDHYQFKCVLSTTVGEFHVRKNGNTVDDYTLTGVNNCGVGSAGSSGIDIISVDNGAANLYIDDFACYDSTGSAPWNDWIGDLRAVQVMPNADSAVQFSRNASTLTLGNTTNNSTKGHNANQQTELIQFNSVIPGTVSAMQVLFNSAATGHFNVAIFDATGAGGAPGSVIANGTATPVTNPTAGSNTFTFATPPTLLPNVPYYFMIISDAGATLRATSGNVTIYLQNVTYSGGAFASPMTPSTVSDLQACATITLTPPAANYAYVQERAEDGSTSYLFDATVGDKDLYTTPGLPFTPSSVLGVSLRGFVAKSDAGSRGGALTMTSGATVQDGPTQALSTTFQNIQQVQDVDPATGVAWTAAAVNALKIGAKVVS